MNPFSFAERAASRSIDLINSVRFRLLPQRVASANARRMADPDRQPITGRAIFEYMSKEYGLELGVRKTYRESNDLRALSVGREPVVSIDRIYFCGVENEPRQGDIVEFPDNPDLPAFEVIDTQRDGHSRLVCRLSAMGSQA